MGENNFKDSRMKDIEERIKKNIIRDYGNIQSKEELEKHIVQHQEHKANLFEDYIAKYFPKDFFKDKTVLEIGCGFGGNIIHLRKHYTRNAYGIDLDKDAIDIAKDIAIQENIDKDAFLHCAAEEITSKIDTKFDVIISLQVLEHVQDVKKSIEEMLVLLKEGGYIFIHVPNYDSKFETHYRLKMPSNKKEDFIEILKAQGIDTAFAESLNFVNKSYFDDILNSLKGEYKLSYILPYDTEFYRKNFNLKQKNVILRYFPFAGKLLRYLIYKVKAPASLVVIIKK